MEECSLAKRYIARTQQSKKHAQCKFQERLAMTSAGRCKLNTTPQSTQPPKHTSSPPNSLLYAQPNRITLIPAQRPIAPIGHQAGHEDLACALGFLLDVLAIDAAALAPDIRDERGADDEGQAEQEQIDRDRVVGEKAVRHGVEDGLREVEQAGQADD